MLAARVARRFGVPSPSASCSLRVWFASLAVPNPIHIAMAMFARATSNLVHQIDPDGSLIPVTRLNNSHKLVPLALVLKRRRRWFWQTPKYRPSDFTLNDLLLGDTPLCPAVVESDFLKYEGSYEHSMSAKLEGGVGPVDLNLEGRGVSKLQSSFGRLKKQEVDVPKLLQASKGRLLNLDHGLVKLAGLRPRVGLAVLKERIVSTQPCSISQQVQGLGGCGAMLALIGPSNVQVSVQENGNIQSDSNVSMEIPEHTVLAYSVIELEVKHNGQYELCLGGFEVDGLVRSNTAEEQPVPGGEPISILHKDLEVLMVHFQCLADLPVLTRSALLQQLKEVLSDRTVLSILEDLLEGMCDEDTASLGELEQLSGPQRQMVRALLDMLQDQSGAFTSTPLLMAMHLLLSAAEEMSDAGLSQLYACCYPHVLKSLQDLVNGVMVNGESALAEKEVCQRVELLFSASNVVLQREGGRLWAETGALPGLHPLLMCIAVQALASLSTGL
ncbi:hypothetical protein AGOR_G00045300 [Albula goreensis]|uniref:Non-syndromic hearing impairment protein 5 n=1 Tax=Albula goreensis TaxID=1534307 RepID=A0A8T3E1E1_9TELE|nr:hypothetical protein AGOR_G00045300 [Albula goreensis]